MLTVRLLYPSMGVGIGEATRRMSTGIVALPAVAFLTVPMIASSAEVLAGIAWSEPLILTAS